MFPTRDLNDGDLKYASRSKAVVIDNRDPQQRGRIRVDHPLLGETVWIPYLSDSIVFAPPAVGDIVYIEADAGHYTYQIAHGRFIDGDDGSQNIPTEFQRSTPSNRGLYTPGGHLLEMDDGEPIPGNPIPDDTLTLPSSRGIRLITQDGTSLKMMDDITALDQGIFLEDKGGNTLELNYAIDSPGIDLNTNGGHEIHMDDFAATKSITITTNGGHEIKLNDVAAEKEITLTTSGGHSVTLSDKPGDENIIVETTGGNSIKMDDTGTKITIEDISSNKVEMTTSGVTITDLFGNTVTMSSSGIKVKEVTGGELNLSSSKVALGASSAELLDLMDQFLSQVHTVFNDLGTTELPPGFGSPLINAAAYSAAASQIQTIKSNLDTIKGTL